MGALNSLSEEMKSYGYIRTIKGSLILYFFAAVFAYLIGKFFRLSGTYELMLMGVVFMLAPLFLRNAYKNKFELQRFSDINTYMEQFLYSFQKTGKILSSLEDTRQLFVEGDFAELLDESIYYIKNTYTDAEVEKSALMMLEEKYPCNNLRTIHKFALMVEKNGGNYDTSLLLLLESRRLWASNTYEFIRDIKKQRFNIFASVVLSLGLCSIIYFATKNMGFVLADSDIVQVVTLVVLVLDFMIFYIADKKLCVSFLEEKKVEEQSILDAMERVEKYDDKKILDRFFKRSAVKRCSREIEKVYPGWLIEIALLLQTENVEVAIEKSIEDAPVILKHPLRRLSMELEEKPGDIKAYLGFLSDYTLPEIRSSVKMLYSISEGYGGDYDAQIKQLIKDNIRLLDKSQKMKNQDKLGGLYGLFLAPQITGAVKLTADMLVLMLSYISNSGM